MPVVELRDSDLARQYVLQSVLLQRLGAVTRARFEETLRWMLELASVDELLPPAGVVSDLGQLILGLDGAQDGSVKREFDYLPTELSRAYEDYVLGKLYADATFERGSTAVCRYDHSDRDRGATWLIARVMERSSAGGIRCSPNIIRTMQREDIASLMAEGSKSIRDDGLMPILEEHYRELIDGMRALGEVLAPADVFELEHETALVEFGQRLALRQALQTASELDTSLPAMAPRSLGRDRNIATNVLEEDCYPVGGFTSISNRGSIESLLQSQLSYMERDESDRPDLFDIKYLRAELLYYSRDENQFLRRRRTFVFALYPDLIDCRIKDSGVSVQRIILVLSVICVAVRRLVAWLSGDALTFEIAFVTQRGASPLEEEQDLISMLLRKHIEAGTASVRTMSSSDLQSRTDEYSRTSLTHCVVFSGQHRELEFANAIRTEFLAGDERPVLEWDRTSQTSEESGLDGWRQTTEALLRALV